MRAEYGDKMLRVTAVVCMLTAVMVLRAYAAVTNVEAWVCQSKVKTSAQYFKQSDAAIVAGGISISYYKGLPWTDLMDTHEGVLIVHPLSADSPAIIAYQPSKSFDKGSKVHLVVRGHDSEPCVRIKIKTNGKYILDEQVGSKWQDLTAPLNVPSGMKTTVFVEIWPVGWSNEYCYIDLLEIIKDGK